VPYKEREIEKKYFSIGEVAEQFKVAASLIRYWEGEFDIIRPKKDKKGNRRYTKDDIQTLGTIQAVWSFYGAVIGRSSASVASPQIRQVRFA
jgi:hypothetical protein